MEPRIEKKPWVTFCMSTYKRPVFLKNQLLSLSQQTFHNFKVIISDNDPEASGADVVKELNDLRFDYYHNGENLGMIKSFNKSIERATTPYIVMLTDDDHVDTDMLSEFKEIVEKHPSFPVYAGCKRIGKVLGQIEIFDNKDYVFQLLNPDLTATILWSSCLLETATAQEIGGIPEFNSPHFADHALLILCGKYKGGVLVNKMFGSLAKHDQNFSKSHFDLYYEGCVGFHNFIVSNFDSTFYIKQNENALEKHLFSWFMDNYFSLKKYFKYKSHSHTSLKEIKTFANKILSLSFMKAVTQTFKFRQFLFFLKSPIFFLKYYR